MNRKLVNYVLIVLALTIVIIIGKDFIGKKAGKNIENPYEYNVDEYRKVDSTDILYREVSNFRINADEPRGIAVSGENIIVVTDKLFLKYNYSGKEILRKELPDTATTVSIDSKNEIWVGTRHSAFLLNQEGILLKRWNLFGERSVITSLAVSGENIYVADAGNRIVYRCDTNGQILERIGEKNDEKGVQEFVIPSPYFDLALDDSGLLWAVNPGMHTFENFNRDGSLRTSWGETSFKISGFSGCCNPAYIAILPDNSFITSEKGMPRIKLYDQHGVFKGVVASPDMFGRDNTTAPDVAVDSQERVVALDFGRNQVRIFEKKKNANI